MGERARVFEALLRNNRDFSKLYEEHKDLDLRLKKLSKQKNLTPEELVESKRMKRYKLMIKDRMQKMLDSFANSGNLG